MGDKRIELQNLEIAAEDQTFFMTPPEVKRTGMMASLPYGPAQAAIKWCWYQWQIDHAFGPISERLRSITEVVATEENAKDARKQSMRGYHEWFVVQCAVLSGDEPTMRLARKDLSGGRGRPRQYYNSLAGMLKARIEDDQKEAERQLAFSRRDKEDGVHPTPSRSLQKSFVERDYATLERELIKGAKRYWKDSFIGKAVVKDEPDHMVIDPKKRHAHYVWAYPEAVIAKLAIMDGATITYDDLWFPLEFVQSFTKPPKKK